MAFNLPSGVYKINNSLYQLSEGENKTLNPINPQEAKARFGTRMSIEDVIAQASETNPLDIQREYPKLTLPKSFGDTTNAPTTATFNKYLQDTNQTTQQVLANPGDDGTGRTKGTPFLTAEQLAIGGQTEQSIPTNQPSPTTVQAQPFTNGGLMTTLQGSTGSLSSLGSSAGTSTSRLPSPQEQGFNQAMAAGAPPVPSSNAQGAALVRQYAPNPQSNTQADLVLNSNQAYQQYLNDFTQSQSYHNQGQSLLEFYNQFSQQLGIPAMDTKLVNLQKIIDGTEEEIRTEVSKANGWITESQLTAMVNGRNKQNIANYNALLAARSNAQNNLTNMVNLADKDRTYAMQQIDRQLNFDQKRIEYADKMLSNAQETYNSTAKTNGWDAVYNSALATGDPQAVQRINSIMGPGFDIATLAQQATQAKAQAAEDRQLDIQDKKLGLQLKGEQILTEKAQRTKIYNDINQTSMGGLSPQIAAKVQASPEYKTINGVLPAIQALAAYKDAIKKYGTVELLSGEGKGTLKGTYGNAVTAWKSLAALGALSGADFSLAENAVPSTGLFTRNSTSTAKLNASIDNAIKQAESLTKRLGQNYPQAASVLESQLDDMRVTAYPNQYKVGPDGLVYKIVK